MRISPSSPQAINRNSQAPAPQPQNAQTITERIVEGTVDNTLAGTDRVSGAISGAFTGAASYLSKMPRAAADGVKSAHNLFKAPKIGPNIKLVAGIATPLIAGVAVAGAGLGLVVATGAGLVNGFTTHNADKPREFTIGKAVSDVWNDTRKAVDDVGKSAIEGSQNIRNIEVKPGDDLWDIPLPPFARTAKTVAATVAGLAMGGLGGVATALATTLKTAWTGVKTAATDFNAHNLAAGVGSIVAAPVTGVLHGLSKVVTTPIEAAGKAWKEDSLGVALKAGAKECYDSEAGKGSSALGALVGGAAVAIPTAAATAIGTTAVELGRGLKAAATDSELNLGGKAMTAVSSVLSAPVAGVLHGVATGVGTPFASAAQAWDKKSAAGGIGKGVEGSYDATSAVANGTGALLGNLPVAVATAGAVTAAAAVREIGGGLVESATNKNLNWKGKVLDAVGGVPGDIVSTLGQGVGTLLYTPGHAASAAFEANHASAGSKKASTFAVNSLKASVKPAVMLETVAKQ